MSTRKTLPKINEQKLIEELKDNSKIAFEKIYNMYAKQLYAFCLQYIKRSEDAEEIVEDIFIHLWEIRNNIKKEDTLRPLLYIMAKNYLINAYRSQVNSPIYEEYINYENILSEDQTTHHLEFEDFFNQFKNALQKLPMTQQKIITLSKIESLNNKEIASRLNLSEQTVKNQLSIGLKTLRKELGFVKMVLFLLFLVN